MNSGPLPEGVATSENCELPKVNGILCFGDSLTQGFCLSRGMLVPYSDGLRERFIGATVVNEGVSGQTTADLMGRLPALLEAGYSSGTDAAGAYDIVLILGGTNDLRFWHDKETIFSNLCALHTEVHQRNGRTAVITLPFVRSSMEQERVDENRRWINSSLRRFAAEAPGQRLLIDLAAAIPQDDAHEEFWDTDGVHLSSAGYNAMSDVIGDALCSFDRSLGSLCKRQAPYAMQSHTAVLAIAHSVAAFAEVSLQAASANIAETAIAAVLEQRRGRGRVLGEAERDTGFADELVLMQAISLLACPRPGAHARGQKEGMLLE
jgi:lysophospholipase L1-like esterase